MFLILLLGGDIEKNPGPGAGGRPQKRKRTAGGRPSSTDATASIPPAFYRPKVQNNTNVLDSNQKLPGDMHGLLIRPVL